MCAECGTRYDSDQNPFCPRCGSTEQGKVVPAALQVARRFDPARRRVQASGALLLLVGGLFLVSSLLGLAVPVGEVAQQFVAPMADQPGGELRLVPDVEHTHFDVVVTTLDGKPIANATAASEPVTIVSRSHATMAVNVTQNGTSHTFHAIVLGGDKLTVDVSQPEDGDVVVSSTLATIVQVGRVVFILAAATLIGGGVGALALRAWGLAAAASLVGLLLALLVLVGFFLAGLLFALPFGFAAYFILRGRRHFRRKDE